MPKWLKMLLAVLFLPLCWGAVAALTRVLRATGQAETFWLSFLGGMACWWVIFLLLPKPMWVYVFGHELTHALWTWLFGGKVKKFKVTSKGGHVVVTKTNFLVALAPYFFPVYVALILGIFSLGHLLWGWLAFRVLFHWLVGVAYGFHVTLTLHILRTRQTDITSQGWMFSLVIIFLGNVLVLLLGIPMLTPSLSISTSLGWWLQESGGVLLRLRELW